MSPESHDATLFSRLANKKTDKKLNTLMIVNPYNKNIIITKSFKQTQIMRQTLKLQYISLFSTCSCRLLGFGAPGQEESGMSLWRKQGLTMRLDEQVMSPKGPMHPNYRAIDVKYLCNGLNRVRVGSCIDATISEFNVTLAKRNSLQQRNRLSRKSVVFDKSTSVNPDMSETPVRGTQYILHSLFLYNFEDLSK